MVKVPVKKHPDYIVVVDFGREIITCYNFNTAVKMYRQQTDLVGPNRCKIYQEVVGYGEEI